MRWFYSISEEENLVKHGRPSLTTDKYSFLKWMNRTLGSHDGSAVKNPPANAGHLGGEDALEKEMATHSSILA